MGRPDTRQVILDATLAVLADAGLAGLSLEDVAARADLSRQTLYRHFGNRRSLVQATIAREEERLLAVVTAASQQHADLGPSLRAALTTLLEWTRDHPLLAKLLASEPDALLPLLHAGDAPVLAAARPAIVHVLAGRLDPGIDIDMAADVLARLMLSYAINPPDTEPHVVAGRLTALLLQGLLRVHDSDAS